MPKGDLVGNMVLALISTTVSQLIELGIDIKNIYGIVLMVRSVVEVY